MNPTEFYTEKHRLLQELRNNLSRSMDSILQVVEHEEKAVGSDQDTILALEAFHDRLEVEVKGVEDEMVAVAALLGEKSTTNEVR